MAANVTCPFCCASGVDLLQHVEDSALYAPQPGQCSETRRWWALREELEWLMTAGVPCILTSNITAFDGRTQAYFPRWLRWVMEGAHENLSRMNANTATSWLLAPCMQTSRSVVIAAQADPVFRETLHAVWRLGHGAAVGAFMRVWEEEHGACLPG